MVQCNTLLWIFLILFLVRTLCRQLLSRINTGHLKQFGHQVPRAFEGEIDAKTLSRMTNYTVDSSRFGSIATLFDDVLMLIILLSGILPWYSGLVTGFELPFIPSALLFLAGPAAVGFIADIPFDLYSTFVIEQKHGFSTTTVTLWLLDLIKGLIISIIIIGLLMAGFFALIRYAPATWWFWSWLLFALFQLLALWLYPVLIAPLFNKYEPVQDAALKKDIIALMAQAGLKTKAVLQVDAGKRSRHSNAYFTGLGKSKRIVLYDTLLHSHEADEILAVLAHEIGHWKKKHIMKQLLFMEAASLLVFYLIYRLLDWTMLYHTFGFDQNLSYVGLFLLSAVAGPVAFFLKPIGSVISRKYERQADDYAKLLTGSTAALARALKRLAKDNLANLHPHPFYAWFYYSHPPLVDRIDYLHRIDGTPPS